jgi:hypothetical protein
MIYKQDKMDNYNAKLYKITCSCCDKIYVGSTYDTKGLSNRMYNHRSDCNKGRTSKLYTHMREQGFDKFNISLIEIVNVCDIDELHKKEQEKVEELNTINNGLNERRAYASVEVKKQQKRISDVKYNKNNRTKINETVKLYRDNLPKSYICECCNYSVSRKDSYDRHCKSKKHIDKIIIL